MSGTLPGTLSRREVGTGITGAGAALLRRRLDAVEGRLSALVLGTLGCRTCAGWADYPVIEVGDACIDEPGSSLLGRYGTGPLRGGWPESLVCPGCGRRPKDVFRLVYVDPPEGWTTSARISDQAADGGYPTS